MKIRSIILILVSLNIVLSNIAWAMDTCGLIDEFSYHSADQLKAVSASNISDDKHADNYCDSFCFGWSHLNYIHYQKHACAMQANHGALEPPAFSYYFFVGKPPTYPPRYFPQYLTEHHYLYFV